MDLKPKYTHISPLLLLFDLLFLKIFASARISYNGWRVCDVPSDTIAPIISKCIALLPINTVGRHLGERSEPHTRLLYAPIWVGATEGRRESW